jgi:hypothetical protein
MAEIGRPKSLNGRNGLRNHFLCFPGPEWLGGWDGSGRLLE